MYQFKYGHLGAVDVPIVGSASTTGTFGEKMPCIRIISNRGKKNHVGKQVLTYACRNIYTPECVFFATGLLMVHSFCYKYEAPLYTHGKAGSMFCAPLFPSPTDPSKPVDKKLFSDVIKLIRDTSGGKEALDLMHYGRYVPPIHFVSC